MVGGGVERDGMGWVGWVGFGWVGLGSDRMGCDVAGWDGAGRTQGQTDDVSASMFDGYL